MTLKKSVCSPYIISFSSPKNTSTPPSPPSLPPQKTTSPDERVFFFSRRCLSTLPRLLPHVSARPALRRSILAWSSSIWFTFTVDTTPPSAPPLAPTPAALAAMRSCHQGRQRLCYAHGLTKRYHNFSRRGYFFLRSFLREFYTDKKDIVTVRDEIDE